MGSSQICGCLFREPRVFTIAHIACVDLFLIELLVNTDELMKREQSLQTA